VNDANVTIWEKDIDTCMAKRQFCVRDMKLVYSKFRGQCPDAMQTIAS